MQNNIKRLTESVNSRAGKYLINLPAQPISPLIDNQLKRVTLAKD
jgi:hypothetical protein